MIGGRVLSALTIYDWAHCDQLSYVHTFFNMDFYWTLRLFGMGLMGANPQKITFKIPGGKYILFKVFSPKKSLH